MQPNDVQKDIFLMLYNAIVNQATFFSVVNRGGNALRASDTLSNLNTHQVGLPNNQWTIEIISFFAVSMAKFQQQIFDFATGPLYTDDLEFVPGPPNACGRQKIHSPAGHISFSVLGVSLVLSIGGVLIFTSLILDRLVGYFRKAKDWKDYKRLQWAMDEQLELERLAYPRDGQGDESSEGNAVSETRTLDNSRSITTTEQTQRLLESR